MSRERGPDMSLAEAGRVMGLKGSPETIGKKAKRIILAKERKIRRQILLRTGGDGVGVRYVVTRWALMKWMPEYFDRRDVVAESFQKYTQRFEERLAKQDAIIEHLGEILGQTLEKLEALEASPSFRQRDH